MTRREIIGYLNKLPLAGDYTMGPLPLEILSEITSYLEAQEEHEEKYRWHDLRKNPDDLPDGNWDTPILLLIKSPSRKSRYVTATYRRGEFKFQMVEFLDRIIAWRYIEPFEEEA